MKTMMRIRIVFSFLVTALMLLSFQNCSKVQFEVADPEALNLGLPPTTVCNGASCDLTPLTKKPAVITALLAIGDEANSQLVLGGASAQFVAETLIRYSSPVDNPKILVVIDHGNGGEDPEDGIYVSDNLLKRYTTTVINEPVDGLKDADVAGYDLVWLNNPGHAMGSINTRDVLLRFAGGVVLQGDDLTRGAGFSTEELTGLRYIDNGTSFTCNGVTYAADNNNGEQYHVTFDISKLAGANSSIVEFQYGNDIDKSEVVRPGLEVLASARGAVNGCTETRPTVVRYEK